MVLRLRKRDCLGKEKSILAEDWLVGALQIWLQLDIVTDILLFLWIIRTNYHPYLFFYQHNKRIKLRPGKGSPDYAFLCDFFWDVG